MLSYLKLFYFLIRPQVIFVRRISNALGDNILLTALLPGIRKKWPQHKIVLETPLPEIFQNNPNVDWMTTKHIKTTKRHIKPKYTIINGNEPNLIAQMYSHIGLNCTSTPQFFLTLGERRFAKERFAFPYITICPVGKTTFSGNRKEWGFENFKKLIILLSDFRFVQIGLYEDDLLPDVEDARGLSIRATAAVIANSLLFVGLEGGLMHLAKSVGKASIIIYGGYIRPEISGYTNNLNIHTPVDCSPCYSSEKASPDCPVMICMKQIKPGSVYRQITKFLSKRDKLI
jgi:ADP-heptose:LPS heptosyltransferase